MKPLQQKYILFGFIILIIMVLFLLVDVVNKLNIGNIPSQQSHECDGVCDEFEKIHTESPCYNPDCLGIKETQQPSPSGAQSQTQQISVKKINSVYKTVSTRPSGWFNSGQEADIMLSGFDFNNAGGPLLFNHPSGIATDGKRLFLVDTFNNRVLIWSNLPMDNIPPDIVLGQKDFVSNNPGTGRDKFNWPFAIATDGKHLVVSDVNNARILIWNNIPTQNGVPADIVIEGGGSFWTSKSERNLPGASWGLWTDGKKLISSNTWSGGTILVWNTFPSRDNQPADLVLTGKGNIGTPRHITSDGNS